MSLNESIYTKTPQGNDYYKTNNFGNTDTLKNDILQSLDENDVMILTKLNSLKTTLSGSNINIKKVQQDIKDLSNFNKAENYEYLSNLLRPEKARGSKIPSQVPVPSCSFQMHNCVTLTTNSNGNCALFFNPVFMASEKGIGVKVAEGEVWTHKFFTTLWTNNNAQLTGNGPNANWVPMSINQTLPDVYDQYRLVSGSMIVKYIGKLDSASGTIGGAIIFDNASTVGGQAYKVTGSDQYNPAAVGFNTLCPELEKYGDFELARDSYYHQENSCIEGVRLLYFPIDNAYEEYTKVLDNTTVAMVAIDDQANQFQYSLDFDAYKSGFNWFFFAQGAPQGNCFKVDVFLNFECLPRAQFLSYMPITINPYLIPASLKKKCIMMAQSKPIGKASDENLDCDIPDIFLKLIQKFKDGLPGFERLAAWGIISAIPGLKSGLALANNMIATNMNTPY